jgi:phage terminase large subunit
MSKSLDIQHTTVFSKNFDALNNPDIRFLINQGGSRSSKTYSLCQMVIVYCLTTPNKMVSIIRKTFPTLRGTVMRDFFEVMEELGLYDEKKHHKTEQIYHFDNGSQVEFFGADNSQKLRGRKRDILWINESNELNFEEYTQLNMRTTEKLIFDFNPSENFHWLYDLISRPESILIHSTYKDNPFLGESQVKEIENLIMYDESYYKIYALGEKGSGKTTIYTHQKYYEHLPEIKETYYGLDFGFNHPTALIEVNVIDNTAYVREIIYKEGLTSLDLVKMMDELGVSKKKEIACDTARPEIIEDLRRKGYNAKGAIKDVKDGIDSVKSSALFIHKESINLLKEISAYKWKVNGDIVLDEPVKVYDDAMDAMRYAIHYWKSKNKRTDNNVYRIRY